MKKSTTRVASPALDNILRTFGKVLDYSKKIVGGRGAENPKHGTAGNRQTDIFKPQTIQPKITRRD